MAQPQLTHVEHYLSGDPLAVRTARRLVADLLAAAPSLLDPDAVAVVTSELVTDAVIAGAAMLVLHVEVGFDRIEIGVVDDVGYRPAPDSGRVGRLRTVEALATRTGVRQLPYRTWRWAVLAGTWSPALH